MRLNCREILRFFDEDTNARDSSNSIKTFAGEELGLALLLHYLNSHFSDACKLDRKCNQGSNGKRLDGWVKVQQKTEPVYYQVEVKSWSFHGYKEKLKDALPLNVPRTGRQEYAKRMWSNYWNTSVGSFRAEQLQKVLLPMNPQEDWGKVLPLACLWIVLHPEGSDDAFFSVPLPSASHFRKVCVFSQSAYLRNLLSSGIDAVDLQLPCVEKRLNYLSRIFSLNERL